MRRRRTILVVLALLLAAGAFALPPAYLDSTRSGAMEGGLVFSVDPLNGRTALGVEFYWISRARVGVGVTSMFSLAHFPATESLSLDALYYLDFDPTGRGLAVMPIKARIGMFGPSQSLGYGLATGVEWYAIPFYYDSNYKLRVSSQPLNCDFFLAFKGLAEVDYFDGRLRPSLVCASDFAGTIGGSSGQGYYGP
ncbi:MAG: hypothetical protein ACLQMF_01045 [Rectinemataceae bacterium]